MLPLGEVGVTFGILSAVVLGIVVVVHPFGEGFTAVCCAHNQFAIFIRIIHEVHVVQFGFGRDVKQ